MRGGGGSREEGGGRKRNVTVQGGGRNWLKKVGWREKLAQKVGRREIYLPVLPPPPPSGLGSLKQIVNDKFQSSNLKATPDKYNIHLHGSA